MERILCGLERILDENEIYKRKCKLCAYFGFIEDENNEIQTCCKYTGLYRCVKDFIASTSPEECGKCKHYRPCKKLVNGKWEKFYICDYLLKDKDGWAMVVEKHGMCECFERDYMR